MNKSVRNLTIYQINKCCKCLFICKSIDIYFSTSIISDNKAHILNVGLGKKRREEKKGRGKKKRKKRKKKEKNYRLY